MDKYKLLVPLAQEILILLIDCIKYQKDEKLIKIGELLNIAEDDDGMTHLDVKTKAIFQEYSLKVFQFTDEFYNDLIHQKYIPRCKLIIDAYTDDEDEDYMELLQEAINSDDFKIFVQSLHKIVLHVSLTDPPITLDLVSHQERSKKDNIFDQYEFKKFKKQELFWIDGFPKEDLPAVVVYPPPMKGKYVYQGIKPSVITLPDADDEVNEYVKNLKEEEKVQPKSKVYEEADTQEEKNSEEKPKLKSQEEIAPNKTEISEKKEIEKPKEPAPQNKKDRVKEKSEKLLKSTPDENNKTSEKETPIPMKKIIPKAQKEKTHTLENPLKTTEPNEPPSFTETKERLISPVPKDFSKIPKSPINIKNHKNDIVKSKSSMQIAFLQDVIKREETDTLQKYKNTNRWEGDTATRFSDLVIKNGHTDEKACVKSPTDLDSLKRIKVVKNVSQTIDPSDIKMSQEFKHTKDLIETESGMVRIFIFL